MSVVDKPIGYWLKHLHDLIDATFEQALADHGIGRAHWQVLQLLSHSPRTTTTIAETMAPFWQRPTPSMGQVLHDLSQRDWIFRDPAAETLDLGEQGRAAHAEIAARVNAIRERSLTGLTRQDYTDAVRVLAAMAHNLEAVRAESADNSSSPVKS